MSIRALAGETAVYGLSSIVGRAVYFLLTPFYTGIFDRADYGVQTNVFAIIAALAVLATLRLDVAYFRDYNTEADERAMFATAWLSNAVVGGLLGLLLLGLSAKLAAFFGYPHLRWLFALGGGILFFDALIELPLARLRSTRRPWRFALVRLTGIVVNVSLNLFWLYFLPRWPEAPAWLSTPLGGVSYIFLATLASSVVSFALLLPELRGLPWHIDGARLRSMLAFSLPLVVVGLSFIVNETLDRTIFPLVYPGSEVESLALLGVYGGAYKLAMLLALFTQAFRYGAEPFFFREAGQLGAEEKYARVAKYFLIASLLGALAVVLFLPALSQLFLQQAAYRAGVDVVPILLAANLCLGMYYNFSVWYKVTDATRYGAYVSLGGAAVTIALNLILIPRFGFYGCAWATLVCYAGMMIATLALGQSRYPVPYEGARMLLYTGLAAAFAVCGWLVIPEVCGLDVMQLAIDGGSVSQWTQALGLGLVLTVAFAVVVGLLERRGAVPTASVSP